MLQGLFSSLGTGSFPMPPSFNGGASNVPGVSAQNQGGYKPDYIEYDDEVPEGEQSETVILSNDAVPKEIGKVVKIGTGGGANQ